MEDHSVHSPARIGSGSKLLRALMAGGVLVLALACQPQAEEKTAEGNESESKARHVVQARAQQKTPKGVDDAQARAAWEARYRGGRPTPGYLEFKTRAAAEAVRTWRRTFAPPGVSLAPTPQLASDASAPAALMTLAAEATPQWANLGPFRGSNSGAGQDDSTGCDSGRIRSIVIHPTNPQLMYIATTGGGVFRATNADLDGTADWNWAPITDNLPASSLAGNVATGDLVMSRTDPQTLYLGMGSPAGDEHSRGFFISRDGGDTWIAGGSIASTATWKIHQVDASVILVGTDQGLWRSSDGGASFTQVRVAVNESYDPYNTNNITSIESFPDGTLVCSRWSFDNLGGQIYYSTNKGTTWSLATMTGAPAGNQILRITIARAPSTTSTAYALAAASQNGFLPGIFRTTDNGRTWAFIARGPNSEIFSEGQPTFNQILTVDPTNASNIFVGGQFLYRSLDGGQNWAQFSAGHVDNHAVTWATHGSSKTLLIGNDGGLVIVREPLHSPGPPTGVDLRRNRGLATHLIYGISSPRVTGEAGNRIAIGLQDNGLRVRTDAGLGLASSGKFDEWAFGDGYSPLYHPQNPDLLLGVINSSGVFRSTDNGRSVSGWLGGITWGTPLVPGLGDPTGNTVFAMSTSNVIYRTTDFGANWVSLPVTPLQFVSNVTASKSSPGTLLAMGSGGDETWLALSRDNGTSWTPVTGANPGNGFVRNVIFDPNDANVLYATSASYYQDLSHIWKSTDQGRTWAAIDGRTQPNGFPFGIPVYVVRVDPTNSATVYAGTDFGVYQSTDGGTSWSRFGVGLPLVAARDLFLSDDGRLLRVGTYGRGIWEIKLDAQNAPTIATAASATLNPVTGTATALSVLGADDGGEANLTYTWATTGTPPAPVTFSVNGGNAAKNSTATFTKAGTYTLQATITDQTSLTVTSAVTVTVLQTLSSVVVTPASATVAISATQPFSASARDQFGNPLASQPTFTWSVSGGGTINGSGVFTAGTTAGGPFTVTAQSAAGSGTAQVTVTATNTAIYRINCGSSSAVTPFNADQYASGGTSRTVTNTIAISGISNPAPQGVYQSERYGSSTYTFPNLTPGASYTVRLHFAELYQTASGRRRFNVLLNGTAVLTDFDIYATAGGNYRAVVREFVGTANASGQMIINFNTVTDNATVGGIEILSATPNQAPSIVTAAAANPSPVVASSTALSVFGADDEGEANLTYTWATAGTPPAAVTFSSNGSNAAKNTTATFTKAGAYTFQVTARDQAGLTATSSIAVTVNATLTSIVVSPASATVNPLATQQYTAVARDQFGVNLASQPSFAWSISGGGSISSNGLFTAGNTAGGPYTVTAGSGTISGTATVTVASNVAYQINCGSASAASPFRADQYASGGTQRSVTNTITINGVTNPAPQAVYRSERYGASTYTFPGLTAAAQYTVRLHFAELYWTASGRRRFNVAINGSAVLSSFDIFASAGGNYRALVREFTTTANASGQIVISFTNVTDNATIEGIEIIRR